MSFDIGKGPIDENTVMLSGEFGRAARKAGLPPAAIVADADPFRSVTTLSPKPAPRVRSLPPEFVAVARESSNVLR